jgi:hypothetical protein
VSLMGTEKQYDSEVIIISELLWLATATSIDEHVRAAASSAETRRHVFSSDPVLRKQRQLTFHVSQVVHPRKRLLVRGSIWDLEPFQPAAARSKAYVMRTRRPNLHLRMVV